MRILCGGRYPELQQPGVELLQGDIRDEQRLVQACTAVDAVFHVAAVPGVWGPWKTYYSINTLGTKNIIRACQRCGVRRLIYTSSPSVVFDGTDHHEADESLPYPSRWLCHYPHSKALAEQAVLAAAGTELKTVSLRPHLIWGPGDNHLIPRLLQRARSGRLRRVGSGRNQVSVSYVENAAAAHLQAEAALRRSSTPSGRAYFINEPDPVCLWDWIDEILALAGLPPVRRSLSASAARRLGAVMEVLWNVLPGEPPMTRFVAEQLSGTHTYSIQAAQRDFDYVPVCSMQEGMKRLEAAVKEAGQAAFP